MLMILFDQVVSVGAVFLALLVRYAFEGRAVPDGVVQAYLWSLPFIIPARVAVFSACGLYRQVWSQASLPELGQIMAATTGDAVLAAIVIYGLVQHWIYPGPFMPRSILIIAWMLNTACIGGSRLVLRLRREWLLTRKSAAGMQHPTLVFGAGDAGALICREIKRHGESGYRVVGFLDDDPAKQGMRVAGVPVLGSRKDLGRIVKQHKITHLIIAMPSAKGRAVREISSLALDLGVHVKVLPGLYELVEGRVSVSQIRDVQIEDLLGREEVSVDLEAIAAYLSGETVLVTGAGGSIGSELCRQIAQFGPRRLVLLGHGENSIYDIHLELREKYPDLDLVPVIADVKDKARIDTVFDEFRPGVVFHAAAHKHVPLMEMNPTEAIKNNVFGTLNVAQAADRVGVGRFVMLSSDKAVNPTSVMGATKRAAELVIQWLNRQSKTVFVAVRFGNVLGSRGSVVPLFQRQIAAGGPVTVTDPRMVRYFMTIPEAVQLVIQAGAMGTGGEVFVLDMGEPVKIVDLARDLIRLSGYEPDVDIPIVFTGARPGEKLYEELLTTEEGTRATSHERIFIAPDSSSDVSIDGLLADLWCDVDTGCVENDRLVSLVNSYNRERRHAPLRG
ncbi:FlaA1/EpsC-like NDP-sugar epimerase [Symbiobacterium terraclitae]|uniref:FlaA1/EpsC-like NDP-sugar epimerase n=1 Tax=Symbiobacterium terraclitae TaxID=557451 RepID=A0ABS4JQR4_9FIRM|nr:nucleoside-diphosphate sugar epimerase/dehydratase [Symbiobacterium terraclitae]MBP2017882.1 FlaA1/EpsC-like NDP-sugar epimerase [Symbiobacterium terraclitae]